MRLLLDTHALLWFCEGNPALSASARGAMEDSTNERYVSHATPWEVAIKVSLGKLDLQVGFDALFPGVLKANGFEFLPSVPDHYRALIPLARYHGDPFDRLMIAQAQVEGLTIITCDSQFPAYGVPLLWSDRCCRHGFVHHCCPVEDLATPYLRGEWSGATWPAAGSPKGGRGNGQQPPRRRRTGQMAAGKRASRGAGRDCLEPVRRRVNPTTPPRDMEPSAAENRFTMPAHASVITHAENSARSRCRQASISTGAPASTRA